MSTIYRITTIFIFVVTLTIPFRRSCAEQYVAKNCEWAKRLEELTQARIKRIKDLGFEVRLRNERIIRSSDNGHEPDLIRQRGLLTEDQKDCALRELKEVENFLRENKYQTYLKTRKALTVWLDVVDNTEGKLPDSQLKYGPELVREDPDPDPKGKDSIKSATPVLVVKSALTSKRSCITVTYENLAFSFDWWDQGETGL